MKFKCEKKLNSEWSKLEKVTRLQSPAAAATVPPQSHRGVAAETAEATAPRVSSLHWFTASHRHKGNQGNKME